MTSPGTVLWTAERPAPERTLTGDAVQVMGLCVNLAGELVLGVYDGHEEAAGSLTRDEATGLRDALTRYLDQTP